jgi:hypothetical protein
MWNVDTTSAVDSTTVVTTEQQHEHLRVGRSWSSWVLPSDFQFTGDRQNVSSELLLAAYNRAPSVFH